MQKLHANSIIAHVGDKIGTSGAITPQDLLVVKEDWTLDTDNHPGWSSKNPTFQDRGGPFKVTKRDLLYFNSSETAIKHDPTFYGPKAGYRGSFRDGSELPAPMWEPTIESKMRQWAPIAYNRMKPTKPSFDGVTELLELRDLGSLLKTKGLTPDLRGASNGHLAIQFGWLPLLRSIRSFVEAQKTWERRLHWLIENEGKPIRRRVHLETFSNVSDPTVSSGSSSTVPVLPNLPSATYLGNWTRRTWTTETRLIWASAQFRFWLPKGPRDVYWTNKMKRRLFGFGASPSAVYAAVPWTWLIGWFSNASQVLKNMEAGVADRCAADYFYVMGTRDIANVSELSFTHRSTAWGPQKAMFTRQEHHLIEKVRLKGDPFGFDTNPGSLSDLQLSILGALGMSRLR